MVVRGEGLCMGMQKKAVARTHRSHSHTTPSPITTIDVNVTQRTSTAARAAKQLHLNTQITKLRIHNNDIIDASAPASSHVISRCLTASSPCCRSGPESATRSAVAAP